MFKDVSFGQYYPTNSPVHRLDARVKLLLTLMYVIGIFFVKSYFGFMLTAVVLIAIIMLGKTSHGVGFEKRKRRAVYRFIHRNSQSVFDKRRRSFGALANLYNHQNREFIQP